MNRAHRLTLSLWSCHTGRQSARHDSQARSHAVATPAIHPRGRLHPPSHKLSHVGVAGFWSLDAKQVERWTPSAVVSVTMWTGLECNIILRKAENREEWRKLVVKSTVVPQPLSARFNGNAMGMARGARFILGRGFLSWGPLGSLSSFPLHNRRACSGQGSPTQTLTERARRPSRAPSPLDLAVCDSVRSLETYRFGTYRFLALNSKFSLLESFHQRHLQSCRRTFLQLFSSGWSRSILIHIVL